MAGERVDHLMGVRNPVEIGAVRGPGDDLDGYPAALRDVDGAAGPIDQHHCDRKLRVEHCAQNCPAPAGEHPDPPHALKVAEAP